MLAKINVHWIIIEDSKTKSKFLKDFLARMPFKTTHLTAVTPAYHKKYRFRGVFQRNTALKWIENNVRNDGVFYFADDDNTYDAELFSELAKIEKVGVFPVGNFEKFGVSSPIVKAGKIVGYLDYFIGKRRWPVDMAGFAINIQFWRLRGKPYFMPHKKGYIETDLLQDLGLITKELQPLASDCSKILVWHTKTSKVTIGNYTAKLYTDLFQGTNLVDLGYILPKIRGTKKNNTYKLEHFGFWTKRKAKEHDIAIKRIQNISRFQLSAFKLP